MSNSAIAKYVGVDKSNIRLWNKNVDLHVDYADDHFSNHPGKPYIYLKSLYCGIFVKNLNKLWHFCE
jgi:hypothetical protein